jgi:tripartite-type tricarboxylate transporter receptor subunit TctC
MKRLAVFLLAMFCAVTAPAAAQDYPDRPIRVYTTSSAGGISDIFMRVLGPAQAVVKESGLEPQ